MSDLELILGPGDAHRGPAIGHSPEHGDNWQDAVEKINGAIKAINELRGAGTTVSSAVSIAASNAPSIDQASLSERLENVELAVAQIMTWLGMDDAGEPKSGPEPVDETIPPVDVPGVTIEPVAAIGSAGDITFGQSPDATDINHTMGYSFSTEPIVDIGHTSTYNGQPQPDGPDASPPDTPPPSASFADTEDAVAAFLATIPGTTKPEVIDDPLPTTPQAAELEEGIAATPGTPETDADPANPNVLGSATAPASDDPQVG